ncbi:MAG: glycosyl hydrolase 53 family protein [Bacteroidales bacterium]|nr:glycosyl hydrolase 53 family protein [Bacteroidales bacterium]
MKSVFVKCLFVALLTVSCGSPRETADNSLEFDAVSRVDSGSAVNVMLTAYSTTLIADGESETRLRVAVTDSAGREIRSADNDIRIYIDGDLSLFPADEDGIAEQATDTARIDYLESRLSDGIAWFRLRAGTEPGKGRVEVRSDGLRAGSHEIHTIPSTVKLMTPSPSQLNPVQKRITPMIGADISFLPQLEENGFKVMENGEEKDVMAVLRNNGFNYIRLRIFVDPAHENGYSPGIGYCGLDQTLDMAKRVKESGMKLLLNFHYSDYWADPQQQNKPAAWAGMDFVTLRRTLKEYTVMVLEELEKQGTPADMVQIGNEINHGLLWPDGHISNPDNLAELLIAGTDGVREVDPEIPVMMHVALGGQNSEAVFWFDNMIARGVSFDIMGISYYPRWHGTLEDLKYNLNNLASRYNKPVNVVEYGDFASQIYNIVFTLPERMGNGASVWEPLGPGGNFFTDQGEITGNLRIYKDIQNKHVPGRRYTK